MPDLARIWTREEVLALPDDGNRYEIIEGELLVTPSPRALHQAAVWALYRRLDPCVRSHRIGYAGMSPSDLYFETDEYVQPDVYVVPLKEGRQPRTWPDFGIPMLVAEVLSPSTRTYDRVTKRRFFQRRGVATYWIVDIDARRIERWTPSRRHPVTADHTLEWQPVPSLPALDIDLPAYFREIWDE